jgi:hypothetical protein
MPMRIEQYDSTKQRVWDEFVLGCPDANVGQLSGNFTLAEESSGATNRSLMIQDDGGELVGVLPLLHVKRRELCMISSSQLTSGGPLFKEGLNRGVARQALSLLVKYAKHLAEQLGVDQVVVNYPSLMAGELAIAKLGYLPIREYGFSEINTIAIYLDVRQEEASLFRSLDPKCRNMVRRAQRWNAKSRVIVDRNSWMACYDLNIQTLSNRSYSRRAMAIIWDEFIAKGFATALIVEVESRIVSAVVISHLNRSAYYWLGFNERPCVHPGASNYALWHGILLCKSKDISLINLGSLEFDSDEKQRGIASFKAGFGGSPSYTLGGVYQVRRKKKLTVDLIRECVRGLHFQISKTEN